MNRRELFKALIAGPVIAALPMRASAFIFEAKVSDIAGWTRIPPEEWKYGHILGKSPLHSAMEGLSRQTGELHFTIDNF